VLLVLNFGDVRR